MEDSGTHAENFHLTSETHAINMKLLKKQKARFLRLQNIFSRNALLMPLCVLFTILSSVSFFAGTLTDHYERINYDLTRLEKAIIAENNLTMSRINSIIEMNSMNTTTANSLMTTPLPTKNETMLWNRLLNKYIFPIKSIATTSIGRKDFFIYEIDWSSKEFALVTRRNYFSTDNSTVKINQIYDSISGIWRRCNNLSSKSIFSLIFKKKIQVGGLKFTS